MKKRLIAVSIVAVGLLAMVAVPVVAEKAGGRGRARAARPHRRRTNDGSRLSRLFRGPIAQIMANKLGLSEEQRDEVSDVIALHRAEIAAVAEAIFDKRGSLRDAVVAEQTDEQAIRAAADDLGAAIGDAAVLAAALKAEVHDILTPEQIETAKKLRAQREEKINTLFRFFLERISAAE